MGLHQPTLAAKLEAQTSELESSNAAACRAQCFTSAYRLGLSRSQNQLSFSIRVSRLKVLALRPEFRNMRYLSFLLAIFGECAYGVHLGRGHFERSYFTNIPRPPPPPPPPNGHYQLSCMNPVYQNAIAGRVYDASGHAEFLLPRMQAPEPTTEHPKP